MSHKKEKNLIKTLVKEHLSNLEPIIIKYKINVSDNVAGSIVLKQIDNETIEIDDFYMNDDYRGLKLAIDAVHQIWLKYSDINKILISPLQESMEFWYKVGFSRLNDSFLILMRGH